jgi:hypothetical protein
MTRSSSRAVDENALATRALSASIDTIQPLGSPDVRYRREPSALRASAPRCRRRVSHAPFEPAAGWRFAPQ